LQMQVGEEAWGQNLETELLQLGFGCSKWNNRVVAEGGGGGGGGAPALTCAPPALIVLPQPSFMLPAVVRLPRPHSCSPSLCRSPSRRSSPPAPLVLPQPLSCSPSGRLCAPQPWRSSVVAPRTLVCGYVSCCRRWRLVYVSPPTPPLMLLLCIRALCGCLSLAPWFVCARLRLLSSVCDT